MVDTCHVANQHCIAPANREPQVMARGECFFCGGAVCAAPGCSIVTTYLTYGRQRVCYACLDDWRRETLTLQRAWVRIHSDIVIAAGYPKGTPAYERELALLLEHA